MTWEVLSYINWICYQGIQLFGYISEYIHMYTCLVSFEDLMIPKIVETFK